MKLCLILHEAENRCPTCGQTLPAGQMGNLAFPDQRGQYNLFGVKYEPEEVEHMKSYDAPPEIDFSPWESGEEVDPKSTTGIVPYNPGSEDPTKKFQSDDLTPKKGDSKAKKRQKFGKVKKKRKYDRIKSILGL